MLITFLWMSRTYGMRRGHSMDKEDAPHFYAPAYARLLRRLASSQELCPETVLSFLYLLTLRLTLVEAPIFSDLPLARVKKQAFPYLQFTFMGPKLFVNTTMTDYRNEPVTGIRLYLEGERCDHLVNENTTYEAPDKRYNNVILNRSSGVYSHMYALFQ
ncbi:hypothetical protein M9H77_25941 [Catharanthus roseus]|uniref:Uncharacterized protein n=1 Tax=Catharanthus roseus TaxID=4058 RepID=A0ACC0A8B8_CATRO|nr:hypothetical protein M9H77_25941 [Catharanthus roseus]